MNNCKSYQTKQKNIIKELFAKYPNNSFTAEQILTKLNLDNTPVSKATLYRTLDSMIACGEIIKYNIDGSSSQYQNASNNSLNYIHFKCQSCGEVIKIENELAKTVDSKLEKKYGIEIDTNKTVLYGKCSNCQRGILK